MKTQPNRAAVLALGLGLIVAFGRPAGARVEPQDQPDLNAVTHEMAERVRHLGEDIDSDLGRTPEGQHLLGDLEELAQATDEFLDSFQNTRDPFQQRRAYSGIHQAWGHLRSRLLQAGASSPAVDRAARRVDELDAQIQQALGLRGYPGFAPPPAPGAPEVPRDFARAQRLAYTLNERADYLASVLQSQADAYPDGRRLARQAERLGRACGDFYDSLRYDQSPEAIRDAFGSVAQVADRIEIDLQAASGPPIVADTWQSFAATEILIREQLGLPTPPPAVRVTLRPAQGPSPLVALSDQLVQQVDAFLAVFGPTVGVVPEGRAIFADAQRLQANAAAFRQDVAAARQIDAYALADRFGVVDDSWQRLARRVHRVGRGWEGPNIQQVRNMGATCEQIHNLLGMPGYPPPPLGPFE